LLTRSREGTFQDRASLFSKWRYRTGSADAPTSNVLRRGSGNREDGTNSFLACSSNCRLRFSLAIRPRGGSSPSRCDVVRGAHRIPRGLKFEQRSSFILEEALTILDQQPRCRANGAPASTSGKRSLKREGQDHGARERLGLASAKPQADLFPLGQCARPSWGRLLHHCLRPGCGLVLRPRGDDHLQ